MSDIAAHDDIPEITLGWRLRIAMERAQLKAEEMAEELGVHRGTITRWTHDIGAPPRRLYLERWSAMCRVPYAWLAGDLYEDPTRRLAPARRTSDEVDNSRGAGRTTGGLVPQAA